MLSRRLWWLVMLVGMVLLWTPPYPASADLPSQEIPPEIQEVIELTNAERAAQGLPPLAYNPQLTTAAQLHSNNMAAGSFTAHEDPNTGTTPDDRVDATGYNWSTIAENVASGYASPAAVVNGWMNSTGHRANILNPNFREIGVGFAVNEDDPALYYQYWTQNFGAAHDYYPVIINNEAAIATSAEVSVYVFGSEINATEMRFAIDSGEFSAWEPYRSNVTRTLPPTSGQHRITAEIRTADGQVFTATDTITLNIAVGTSDVATATPIATLSTTDADAPPLVPPVTVAPTATATPMPAASIPIDDDRVTASQGLASAISIQSTQGGFEGFRCVDWESESNGFPFWGAAVVLAFFVLLLIMILYRALAKHWWMVGAPNCGWRCQLFRWSFLAYTLLLVGIGSNMTGGLCNEAGTLLWRADSSGSADIVSIDNNDPSIVYQVEGLETETCIGCHTYSDTARMMAFTQGGLTGSVMILDRNTETTEALLINGQVVLSSYTALSPDGSRLAIARNDQDLIIYNFDTDTVTDVAVDPSYVETMPAWDRNGEVLYYVRSEQPANDGAMVRTPTDIYRARITPDGTGGYTISDVEAVADAAQPGVFEYYPAVDPSGQWLVYTRHQNETTYADEAAELWTVDLSNTDSSDPVPLASGGASWGVYSGLSNWMAYRSVEQDASSDVFIREVDTDGPAADRFALSGADTESIFEHLPAAWVVPPPLTWSYILAAMLPWLLPLPFLLALAQLWCFPVLVLEEEEEPIDLKDMRRPMPMPEPPPVHKRPVWEPEPALIIGFGKAGRWTLTHFKKTMQDAGLGDIPPQVPLLCIAAGDEAQLSQSDGPSHYNFGGVELSADEIIEWQDSLQTLVSNADNDAALRRWFPTAYVNSMGRAIQDPTQGLGGQRTLGRLVLIQDLRRGEDSRVWQQLRNRGQRAVSDKRLTVIIVLDSSDDVGSGAALDVAYLCRQLQSELDLRSVKLIAHITTDRVDPATNPLNQQVNTAAFLRELSRFQLAQACPVPMYYGEKVQFNGRSETVLFDELYLYDGQTYPIQDEPPPLGLYPLIADSMALWLDKGATQQLVQRTNAINAAREQQVIRQSLIVSSLGIQQYRLPVADLLEDITLNYMRNALQVFLAGTKATETTDRLPTPLNYTMAAELFTMRDGETPDKIAWAFLREEFGSPPGGFAPRWHRFWRILVDYQPSLDDNRNKKVPLSKAIRSAKIGEEDIEVWQRWLQMMLRLILNGQADEVSDQGPPNYLVKRGGKLGLATDLLRALSGTPTETGIIARLQRKVSRVEHSAVEAINEQLQRFSEYASRLLDAFTVYEKHLATGTGMTLYRRLARQAGEFETRRDQLQQLRTRLYVWTDQFDKELRTKWYDPIKNKTEAILSRLHWDIQDDKPVLLLRLSANESILYTPDDADVFIDAMRRVAYSQVESLWRQDTLFSIMQQRELDPVKQAQTLDDAMKASAPALRTPQQTTTTPGILLSIGDDSTNDENVQRDIADYLRAPLPNPNLLREIRATDAFSFTVAQTLDGIEIQSKQQMVGQQIDDVFEQYNIQNGIKGGMYDPERSIPLSIFGAEATALKYERQRGQLNVVRPDRRTRFAPLTVAMLAHAAHVESYALALVSDIIDIDVRKHAVRLNADTFSVTLIQETDDSSTYGLLLTGLLHYIRDVPESQASELLESFTVDAFDYLDEWQSWLEDDNGQSWIKLAEGLDIAIDVSNDLADIARIKILELL